MLQRGGKDFCAGFSRALWNSFKLDLKGERNKSRVTRDKPESCAPVFVRQYASNVLHSSLSVGCHKKVKTETDTDEIDIMEVPEKGNIRTMGFPTGNGNTSPTGVHLQQCTRHRQQTGGTINHCAAGKLWHSCHHGNMVGWLAQLECCNGQLQNLLKGRKLGRRVEGVALYVREWWW